MGKVIFKPRMLASFTSTSPTVIEGAENVLVLQGFAQVCVFRRYPGGALASRKREEVDKLQKGCTLYREVYGECSGGTRGGLKRNFKVKLAGLVGVAVHCQK